MRVFLYWNLHKLCWSLKAMEGPNKGRVIAHAVSAEMTDCTFKVSENARLKVVRDKCKSVHAGIVGQVVAYQALGGAEIALTAGGVPVTYNPYKAPTFTTADEYRTPVGPTASRIVCTGRKVSAFL